MISIKERILFYRNDKSPEMGNKQFSTTQSNVRAIYWPKDRGVRGKIGKYKRQISDGGGGGEVVYPSPPSLWSL